MSELGFPSRRNFLSLGVSGLLAAGCQHGSLPPTPGPVRSRGDFLLDPGLCYVNTAAVGPTSRSVLDVVHQASLEVERNPTKFAYRVFADAMDSVRAKLANWIVCDVDEISLISSTTSGVNSLAEGVHLERGDHVLTSNQEHEGGLAAWKHLSRHRGAVIDEADLPPGEGDPERILSRFEAAWHPRTRILFVSHVLYTTGIVLPIARLAELARSKGALFIVDGAQSAASLDFTLPELGCHAFVAGGHKWLLGPKGTGFLFLSKEGAERIRPTSLCDGPKAYSSATGLRPSPLFLGLGAALQEHRKRGSHYEAYRSRLRRRLDGLLRQNTSLRIVSPTSDQHAIPIVTFALPPETPARKLQARLLEHYGIQLKALPSSMAHPLQNCLRVSLHDFNTEEDVDRVVAAMREECK